MKKVLIVDDEMLVRFGLANCVDWEKFDCELIGEISNGREALSFILEHRPDLIFLDITMPDMGGIELMQKLQELDLHPKIIILSCHDEFEYVKNAMKLGASEYILKLTFQPSDVESLLKRELSLAGGDAIEKSAMQVSFQSNRYFALSIQNVDDPQAFQTKEALICDIGKGLSSQDIKLSCDISNQILVITFGISESAKLDDYSCINISQRFRNALELISTGRLLCGLSRVHLGENARIKAKQESKIAMDAAFFDYRKMHTYQEGYKSQFGVQNMFAPLELAILSNSEDAIHEYFQSAKKDIRMSSGKYKACLISCIGFLAKKGVDMEQLHKEIEASKTIDDIEEALIRILRDLKQLKGTNRYVLRVMEEIHNNYQNPEFSLELLSKGLGLNSSYLSKLFKSETGQNFIEYLNATRIEAAIRLISLENYTVTEAAIATGFQNIHYFSKVFKKVTDHNPSEMKYKNKKSINTFE